jgi:hypothetical protein
MTNRIRVLTVSALLVGSLALTQDTTTESTTTEATATVGDDGTVAVTGLTLPGQDVSVPAECEALETRTAKVVCAAEAFLATLSEDQQAEVLLELTQENAVVWSNLPVTFVPRNGVELGSLDETQLAAAYAFLATALGTTQDEGYSETMQILMADDILAASGGMQNGMGGTPPDGGTPPSDSSDTSTSDTESSDTTSDTASSDTTTDTASSDTSSSDTTAETTDAATGTPPSGGPGSGGNDYSRGLYYLAFLGTPSTTDTWILQFGGHHLAFNITYRGDAVAGATPKFTGIEPKVWTTEDATYAPMASEHDNMAAMLAGLDETQLATAQLSETFSDVLLGPGQDGQFPTEKEGLAVSELSDEQKALVLAAIAPWVQDVDDMTSSELLAIYEEELDETYIAYSGNSSLTNHADYVRIDGPSVWIEFVNQNGIVYSDQIHYHTVWRDRARDYGAEFSF